MKINEDLLPKQSKIDVLWSGDNREYGDYKLNNSIEDYDFILVSIQADSYAKQTAIIPLYTISYGDSASESFWVSIYQNDAKACLNITFKNAITIYIRNSMTSNWQNVYMQKVVGVKL